MICKPAPKPGGRGDIPDFMVALQQADLPRVEVAQPGLDMGKHVVACKIAADDVERRAHEQGERLCWKFRSFVCKHGHAMLFEHAVEHAAVLVLIAAENGDLPVAQTLFPYETADL